MNMENIIDKYEIKLGQDLIIGDKIVYCSKIVTIIKCVHGSGAGSFDFGEYVSVIISPCDTSFIEEDVVWLYMKCPYVVVKK